MEKQTTTEGLLHSARIGNTQAQSEIYAKLFARFLPIISLNIQEYPVLVKGIDTDEKCREVSNTALLEIKKLYPLSGDRFSIKRAVSVLHNVIDDFIADTLFTLAKKGDNDAEKSLFSLLRKKLIIYIKSRLWGR